MWLQEPQCWAVTLPAVVPLLMSALVGVVLGEPADLLLLVCWRLLWLRVRHLKHLQGRLCGQRSQVYSSPTC